MRDIEREYGGKIVKACDNNEKGLVMKGSVLISSTSQSDLEGPSTQIILFTHTSCTFIISRLLVNFNSHAYITNSLFK